MTTKSSGEKECDKGYRCGDTCIQKGKSCLDSLSPEAQRVARAAIDFITGSSRSDKKMTLAEVDAVIDPVNAKFLSTATPAEIIARAFQRGRDELGEDYTDDPAIVDAVWDKLDPKVRQKIKTKGKINSGDYWDPTTESGHGNANDTRGKYMVQLLMKQNGKDAYTGLPIDLLGSDLEHIVPLSVGGKKSEDPSNFVLVSRGANQNRANAPLSEWVSKMSENVDKVKAKLSAPPKVDKSALASILDNTPKDNWQDSDIDAFGSKFYYASKHLGLTNSYQYDVAGGRTTSGRPPASWGKPVVKAMAKALRDNDLPKAELVKQVNNSLLASQSDKANKKVSEDSHNENVAKLLASLM